jgi:thymidylate synthase
VYNEYLAWLPKSINLFLRRGDLKDYIGVVNSVLDHGIRKSNRTGVDTISLFGVSYLLDMDEGFPLLTTKRISWKNIICENLWFLSGEAHVQFLQKHGCKFWNPWVDPVTNCVPSAYGYYWRNFPQKWTRDGITTIDQIKWVISELRRNPNSRRLVVNAWHPENAHTSSLPPCHYSFVLNTQGDSLNLMMTQRSLDVALGLPYNIAGYCFLLHLFARLAHLEPGQFMHAIADCHIYENHISGLQRQLERIPRKLPTLQIAPEIKQFKDVEQLIEDGTTEDLLNTFKIKDYNPAPEIKFEVAV